MLPCQLPAALSGNLQRCKEQIGETCVSSTNPTLVDNQPGTNLAFDESVSDVIPIALTNEVPFGLYFSTYPFAL